MESSGETYKEKSLSLCTPWREVGGGRVISPLTLDLSTGWKEVARFAPPASSPRGMFPLYPLGRKVGGPQIWSGHLWEQFFGRYVREESERQCLKNVLLANFSRWTTDSHEELRRMESTQFAHWDVCFAWSLVTRYQMWRWRCRCQYCKQKGRIEWKGSLCKDHIRQQQTSIATSRVYDHVFSFGVRQ